MIPEYRLRIYCLICALLCLLCAWAVAEQLNDALNIGQFDSMTGRSPHKVKEHFVFDEQPRRFSLYLLRDIAVFIASGGAGLAFSWGALRGRRSFKRLRAKF
ncbi:hypothetical protein IAI51_11975 [Pseudomonas sp. N40(2020)]|uniref:hypothetical protein n=1 Tax=Pseudomonas sp. N40(2020) TaxID=2767798 RepID=UPI0016574EF0|nr:hypothetical protein [Pseudomonas sp. N40(2020)]MBC8997249.1 hypothetical protein [Pseudomonas sp. N40(2020)]